VTPSAVKYIALLALVKIVPSHPHLVAEHQDIILACVDHEDTSIRLRALDLISAMVCPLALHSTQCSRALAQVDHRNLQPIVQQLLSHLVQNESGLPSAADALRQSAAGTSASSTAAPRLTPAYRLLLAQHILRMCAHNTYEHVVDFEWFLSVLVDLVYVAHADIGTQLRDTFIDVVGRVRGARRYAVTLAVRLLGDSSLLLSSDDEGSCLEILWAAAWVAGEYCRYVPLRHLCSWLNNTCSELAEPHKLLPSLLNPDVAKLAPETVAVYVHSAAKIFAFWAAELAERWDDDNLPHVKALVDETMQGLTLFVASVESEVQERVRLSAPSRRRTGG
jgi:AP-3 complex subunit delta-1